LRGHARDDAIRRGVTKGQRDDASRDEGDVTCVNGEATRNEEATREGREGGRRGVMKDVTRCRRGKKEG
jgi:hypothetical protein